MLLGKLTGPSCGRDGGLSDDGLSDTHCVGASRGGYPECTIVSSFRVMPASARAAAKPAQEHRLLNATNMETPVNALPESLSQAGVVVLCIALLAYYLLCFGGFSTVLVW